jgi:hypothetical protein
LLFDRNLIRSDIPELVIQLAFEPATGLSTSHSGYHRQATTKRSMRRVDSAPRGKHRNGPTKTTTVAPQLHLLRFANMAKA